MIGWLRRLMLPEVPDLPELNDESEKDQEQAEAALKTLNDYAARNRRRLEMLASDRRLAEQKPK